mgnify:FL=1
MSLESAYFISSLVPTNPPGTDLRAQGDDHLRLIKSVLQNTFPNAFKAFLFPTTAAVSTVTFSIPAEAANCTFLIDTTSTTVSMYLPPMTAGDAGWECSFIKVNTGVQPYYVSHPSSGTLLSGPSILAYTRRCIPGARVRALWTGSIYIIERTPLVPVGTILDFDGAVVPVGYEWANGQTLASSNYPDFAAVKASGITTDLRGRVAAGKDNMGGTAAGRVTSAGSGVDGATLGAVGGVQITPLDVGHLPVHSHTGSLSTDGAHSHTYDRAISQGNQKPFSGGTSPFDTYDTPSTSTAGSHTHTVTIGNT